jgi:hypothetical protein
LKNLLALIAVASLALAGCGGGSFSCSDKGKCPNDPPTTQSEINDCNAAMNGACGSQYKAFGSCALSTQKCGSDGKTDTNNVIASCSVQISALSSCCSSHPGTAGC